MSWAAKKQLSRRVSGGKYEYEVFSPNRRLKVVFAEKGGEVFYVLKKDGKVVLRESRLGMSIVGEESFGKKFKLVEVYERDVSESWETVYGEERVIANVYHEGLFCLCDAGNEQNLMAVRVRVFDEGIGFRYEFPEENVRKEMTVKEELTEFNVDQNGYAWWIPAYQPDRYEYLFRKDQVLALDRSVHTPLTIKTTSGDYISIHEAALYDYGGMVIHRWGDTLRSEITPLADGNAAHVKLPFNTPWRVVMVGDRAMDLTTNRIVLNLNDPPVIETDWIKPVKYLGIWWALHIGEWTWKREGGLHGATTENAMEYIDYCAKLGICAVLVEGWNECWEGDWLSGGRNNKFTVAYPDFDIEKVTSYAKEKGVELVGHHETMGYVDNYESQLPAAYEYYQRYGVRYAKLGYVGSKMLVGGERQFHHSQAGVRHYQMVTELAAKYGIMLNVHEPIKGTGTERTWPNLMTREGGRGQEYEGGGMTPEHHTMIPFTRCLAGAFDYTPGVFDIHSNGVKTLASTVARQLALFVTIYSPWQMAADRPRFYEGNPAFKFIADVPVSWEKTVPLVGSIGEYFVVARKDRESEDWYVGGVTNENARTVTVYTEFLEEGREYSAEIYKDGEGAHFRDNPLSVAIEKRTVRKGDKLSMWMAGGGGFGIRFGKV